MVGAPPHAPRACGAPRLIVAGRLIIFGLSEAFVSFDINGNRMLWFALGLAFALPHLRSSAIATTATGG